jgi:hypothetical protein
VLFCSTFPVSTPLSTAVEEGNGVGRSDNGQHG